MGVVIEAMEVVYAFGESATAVAVVTEFALGMATTIIGIVVTKGIMVVDIKSG